MKRWLTLLPVLLCAWSCDDGATPAKPGAPRPQLGSGLNWQILSVRSYGGAGGRDAASAPLDPPVPALRSNSVRASIALGSAHACMLPQAGPFRQQVMCWGSNTSGQLGDGTNSASDVPVQVQGLPAGDPPLQLAAGNAHTCVVLSSGAIYCWGDNESGQLGVDPKSIQSSNTAVRAGDLDSPWSQVAAGGNQTCALDSQSEAACWGSNTCGQLGNGTTVDAFAPQPILVGGQPVPFGHIATGIAHTCAVVGPNTGMEWGTVYCWGDDTHAQLGNSRGSSLVPVAVLTTQPSGPDGLDGLTLQQRLAAGATHTCGLTGYGTYYCWGNDSEKQLSVVATDFDSGDENLPFPPEAFGDATGPAGFQTVTNGLVPFTSGRLPAGGPQLVSGSNHVCALGNDGFAWCWGANDAGQLGIATKVSSSGTPLSIRPGSARFTELAGGFDWTCGVTDDGNVACWGSPGTPTPTLVSGGPWFPDVTRPPSAQPPADTKLVDCTPDPNAGFAPNAGNIASYLYDAQDVFTASTRVTEVDFELFSDESTSEGAYTLTLYSYSPDGVYTELGSAVADNLFQPGLGGVVTARFIFDGDGVAVTVPEGAAAQPVVLQLTQQSGITLDLGANLILNPQTASCPVESAAVIPMQIYVRN